jgi:antitoxin CptB
VTEARAIRIKRLSMRSMRRGIKEMDLILSRFAAVALANMDEAGLAGYERLLAENDHDIYAWITGQTAAPATHAGLVGAIAEIAKGLTRPA